MSSNFEISKCTCRFLFSLFRCVVDLFVYGQLVITTICVSEDDIFCLKDTFLLTQKHKDILNVYIIASCFFMHRVTMDCRWHFLVISHYFIVYSALLKKPNETLVDYRLLPGSFLRWITCGYQCPLSF